MDEVVETPKRRIRLDPNEELKIVALLARGDSSTEIRAYFKSIGWIPPTQATVSHVKTRNKENLDIIKNRMLAREAEDSASIKAHANKAIKRKLSRADRMAIMLDQAFTDFESGNITIEEYRAIANTIKDTPMADLVSVSREMHNQSRSENDDNNTTPKKDLTALVDAIKSGDEVKLQQIIFNGK